MQISWQKSDVKITFFVKFVIFGLIICIFHKKSVPLHRFLSITIMEERKNSNRMPSLTTEGKLRVKELLKGKGMTMKELAQRIGGNREVISRALSGNPTYSVLANIAAALEVPISELFVTPKPQQHTINGVISCDEQTYIIKDLSDIEAAIEDIKKITSH